MEESKQDYEKLMNTLLQKKQSKDNYSDLKTNAEKEYKETLEKYWNIKGMVMEEKFKLANTETQVSNFDDQNTAKYYDDLPNKLDKLAKRSAELDVEYENMLADAGREMKSIIEHYNTIDHLYAPENMERLTAEIIEQQKIHIENIKQQTNELEFLERKLDYNIEIPNFDGVFDDDFKDKYSDKSLEIKQKKLDDLTKSFDELTEKLRKLD